MLKIGLTGNIGSGKTVVANVFKAIDIPVYNSDEKAGFFLNSPKVIQEIKNYFGAEVISTTGDIDKKKLAEIVFSDNNKLLFLNNIIHPIVIDDFNNWAFQQQNKPYIIMESAILFKTGFYKIFDKNIFVSAPKNLRSSRVIKRDNINKSDVLKRINNQLNEEEQINIADYLIVNDDKSLIIPQILKIHSLIKTVSTK